MARYPKERGDIGCMKVVSRDLRFIIRQTLVGEPKTVVRHVERGASVGNFVETYGRTAPIEQMPLATGIC